MYALVRKDLSIPQQVVQVSHACIEATKAFLDLDIEHPHLVVLSVKTEKDLLKAANRLKNLGVRYCIFTEPDRNNEATALATEIIFDEKRKIFKNYQCLKEIENES